MDIICIDDQEDVQELMTMMLEDEMDANVHCFSTSQAALDFLKTTELKISIILCDYNLEDGSTGLDFSNEIQSLNMPFILITGMCFSSDDKTFNTFIDRSNCSVLYKPFSDDDLVEKIKKVA